MLDCGHVFCIECLQDFYNNAIKEGDLASVRCLEPSCAKTREDAQAPGSKKRRKPKTYLSPSELLQIPLDPETVKRYVTLKYKTELESDKNVIYCPREGCQGAARSKKHKKPEGFELHETEDDSEPEDENPIAESSEASKPTVKPFKLEDRLAVCEDCGFAFCSRCYKGWHGDYVICHPSRGKEELSEEEKASLDFISLHTTPCPTCACPAQKTHGCNHMYVMLQLAVSLIFTDVPCSGSATGAKRTFATFVPPGWTQPTPINTSINFQTVVAPLVICVFGSWKKGTRTDRTSSLGVVGPPFHLQYSKKWQQQRRLSSQGR